MSHWFDDNVKKPITLFSHPFWIICLEEEICPCVNHVTKEANKECLRCLGTGHKIALFRVNGAHQNHLNLAFRGEGIGFSEKDIVTTYYTYDKTPVKPRDIVVDGEDIDVVEDVFYERSDQQKVVYWRIETAPYKMKKDVFRATLLKLFEKAGVTNG